MSAADAANAASGSFEQAFGWTTGAAASELTVFDGIEGAPPGCPPLGSYAVTGSTPPAVNAANMTGDLVLSGSSQDASAVAVTLIDRLGTTLTQQATPSPATGPQTWTVTFPGTDVANLADGNLVAAGSYSVNGGTISGINLMILKDTRAPQGLKATPAQGVYNQQQSVTLSSDEPGAKIYFLFGGNTTPDETSTLYTGPIVIAPTTTATTINFVAVDQAGNKSLVQTQQYTFDLTPPVVTIDTHPGNSTNHVDVAFGFSANEGVNFQCSLTFGRNPDAFVPCESAPETPWSYSLLDGQGTYTFKLRATDTAGNIGEALHRFTLDTSAPAAPTAPDLASESDMGRSNSDNLTNVTKPAFTGSAEPGATVTLFAGTTAVGSGSANSAGTYSITITTVLDEGKHTITAQATDMAGNSSALSDGLALAIDTTAPTVSVDALPQALIRHTNPQFSFSASEPDVTFACSLSNDVESFTACGSPQNYSSLREGDYTFKIQATDAAGNTGTSNGHTFRIEPFKVFIPLLNR